MDLEIRKAEAGDADGIWAALAPVFAAGDTYAVPRDWGRETGISEAEAGLIRGWI